MSTVVHSKSSFTLCVSETAMRDNWDAETKQHQCKCSSSTKQPLVLSTIFTHCFTFLGTFRHQHVRGYMQPLWEHANNRNLQRSDTTVFVYYGVVHIEQNDSPGVRQVNWQQLAAGNPECWMALGIIDDLQQELPVVIVDFLSSQCTIIIHRQQVPPIHLKRRRHIHKTLRYTKY